MLNITAILLGPLVAAVLALLPLELAPQAHTMACISAWIVIWWVFEAIPLAATSILAATLMVVFGVCDSGTALAPFAHPMIYLFMGGFFLAKAMQVHQLDRRIALGLLLHPLVRGNAKRSLYALLFVTAFLSMWISNTATAAMLLPITIGLTTTLLPEDSPNKDILLIGMAYAASIGGIATPVGSPPNIIALGMLSELAHIQVTFLEWMAIGTPLAIACTLLLAHSISSKLPHLKKQLDVSLFRNELDKMGPLSSGQIKVVGCLLLAILFWVGPGIIALLSSKQAPAFLWLKLHFPEAIVSLMAAMLLFIFRDKGKPLLTWNQAIHIDWAALILFGGGLSLGTQLFNTGLAQALGGGLLSFIGGASQFWLFVFCSCAFALFFTETTSNTAAANMLVPLVIATTLELGNLAILPTVGVALACSLAFMLPVATPPNAIVYGSQMVRLSQMIRMGWAMNLKCLLLLMLALGIMSFSL